MNSILDILTRFPNCRVTIRSGPSRPKPCAGDIKVLKDGTRLVRRQQIYQGMGLVRNGRPRMEWVREGSS